MHTILVVDNNEDELLYISEILKENDYKVIPADSGKKAIELYYENKNIDLILSDLKMPGITGQELAKYNYNNRNIPFIACTGLACCRASLELLKLGVQDYLLKPFDKGEFVHLVKNVLQRVHHSPENGELTHFEGNISFIKLRSKRSDIDLAQDWIEQKLENTLLGTEKVHFVQYVVEFITNAYEHGNLKITEEEKSNLIKEDRYIEELEKRELSCNAIIEMSLSIVGDEVAVHVSDEGDGFDYKQYLNMPEDQLIERLHMPNGRGIFIANTFFDTIEYSRCGASVLLIKTVSKQ
ncbi:MAG: response regulator [Nitrospinae bacterium]|nr:response regulator [Nitrospinota bacterium]